MAFLTLTELLTIGLGALIGAMTFTGFLAALRRAARAKVEAPGSATDIVSIPPYSPQKALHRSSSPRTVVPVSVPPRPAFAYACAFQGEPKPTISTDETGPASVVTVAAIAGDLL